MAEPTPGPAPTPPAAGAQPAAGGAAFGNSPATQPTANAGQSAAGMALMSVIQKMTLLAVGAVGPSSPAGADLRKSLDLISKHVPAGAVSPATEANVLKALLMKLQQQAPQVAQMQQMAQRGMAGGQPPGAANGNAQPGAAAMPSPTPQPAAAAA